MAPPAFAVLASLRICRRSFAGLHRRPLRARGKVGGEIERVQAGIKLAGSISQRAQVHTDNSPCLSCNANLDFPSNNLYS